MSRNSAELVGRAAAWRPDPPSARRSASNFHTIGSSGSVFTEVAVRVAHTLTPRCLFQDAGRKIDEGIILYRVVDLYRVAAHFTVLDVGLGRDRCVEHH